MIEVKVPGILFVLAEGGICGVRVFCFVICTFCRTGVKRGVDA